MYEAFYGFREKPFSMLPDPGFLYLSKKHQTALTLLEYALLNHVGFCVISGEPGAGKTTVLRALLERAGDDVTVGMITNTHQSFGGLLDWILSAFDLHKPSLTHVEMHQVFMDYLINEYANNRTVLLIVDEAQNMNAEVLEELRMLSNVNSAKDQLVQIVLAGQPALKELLRLPELKQFAQRIAVDYHLEPLSLKETFGYIQHRLIVAGAEKDVFTPAACERIHRYSGGTPRLINLLCETVLVYGFADQQDLIDVDLVEEMVNERMKDSVVPLVNRDTIQQDSEIDIAELEKDFPWIKPEDGSEGFRPELSSILIEQPAEQSELDQSLAEKSKAEGNRTEVMASASKEDAIPKLQMHQKVEHSNRSNRYQAPDGEGIGSGESSEAKPQLIKYGVIAIVVAILLIAIAVMLQDETKKEAKVHNDQLSELQKKHNEAAELQKQREFEQTQIRMKQLQDMAEALKSERDAALAIIEVENKAKQKAQQLAAEVAANSAKAVEDKKRLQQEQKKLAAVLKKERMAKEAKAKARAKARADAIAEVQRAKKKAAKLAEEKRIMAEQLMAERKAEQQAEDRRIKKIEEARQAELERLKNQPRMLQATQPAIELEQQELNEEIAAESKKSSRECSGAAAKFKSSCR